MFVPIGRLLSIVECSGMRTKSSGLLDINEFGFDERLLDDLFVFMFDARRLTDVGDNE
jgi:hypothetical protein